MTTWRAPAADTAAKKQRRTIRYLAAAIAAVTAVMYLLSGFGFGVRRRCPRRFPCYTEPV
jgi:hypothetical protein